MAVQRGAGYGRRVGLLGGRIIGEEERGQVLGAEAFEGCFLGDGRQWKEKRRSL